MSSIWPEFGFQQSPYSSTPIPATAEGQSLLVGRDRELLRLKTVLASTALHPTVEGENGVGKTSLVAVAGFQLFEAFRRRLTSQALIPLDRAFQLTSADTVDQFRRKVLYEAAQALIEHYDVLKTGGLNVPDVADVRKWLTRAVQRSGGGGLSAFGFGISGSKAASLNSSTGYSESGFGSTIEAWLRECFPSPQAGGFLCVIDNLELLVACHSSYISVGGGIMGDAESGAGAIGH